MSKWFKARIRSLKWRYVNLTLSYGDTEFGDIDFEYNVRERLDGYFPATVESYEDTDPGEIIKLGLGDTMDHAKEICQNHFNRYIKEFLEIEGK